MPSRADDRRVYRGELVRFGGLKKVYAGGPVSASSVPSTDRRQFNRGVVIKLLFKILIVGKEIKKIEPFLGGFGGFPRFRPCVQM